MAIPGPGFLATFAGAPRSNADWDRAEAHRRTPSFVDEAGRSHPNRGAISPWNRVTLRTTKPISAGSEIVVHYDDPLLAGQSSSSSADDDNENDADEHAVTSEDYRKIDETIQQMLQFFDKHAANLDDGARDQIYRFLVQDFMEAAVGPIKARRVAELFPPGPQELVHVPLVGGIKNYSNDTSRVQLHRVEWLQSSGYCYDQVRKRCFGSSFVFVPFVPGALLSHNRCYLFSIRNDDETGVAGTTVRGKQLLTNYVLGHPESTMVFLPASSAVYLNHNATPNGALRWASESQVGHHNADWAQVSPPDLVLYEQYYTVGLLMEVVALRDIEAGEEIFLSYGPEWEAAWTKHEQAWKKNTAAANDGAAWPLRAADLNERHRLAPFPTEDEWKRDPSSYPKHVTLKAFVILDGEDEDSAGTLDYPYTYAAPALPTESNATVLFEVTVVERRPATALPGAPHSSDVYTYTVKIDTEDDADDEDEVTASYVSNVPHSALVFVDRPGTGDHFFVTSSGAKYSPFRRSIGIPNDVFPKGVWRNKSRTK